jgi:hypothetical protein
MSRDRERADGRRDPVSLGMLSVAVVERGQDARRARPNGEYASGWAAGYRFAADVVSSVLARHQVAVCQEATRSGAGET